jgi:hypothetical protein
MELQIIRAQEFVRLGAHGRIDLKASKEILAKLAAACWKRGINQALLDLRALHVGPKPVFSPNDLAVLVNTFREIGFTHRERLAVLYSADPHHRARMFSFIATLHGWNVRAFAGFEEAVAWLSGAEPEHSEVETVPTTKAVKVPVRQLKHLKAGSKAKPAPQPTIQIKSITSSKPGAIQPKTRKHPLASARATLATVRPDASELTREARTQL